MNIDRCNTSSALEVSSPIEMLPVELIEKILTIANNPTARAVNLIFRDAQRAVDQETLNQYLQQPCINRFVSYEFTTFPHDLMNPDAHHSRHQMIQRINHAIITPALNKHPSPNTVLPAEQLNEYAQNILDANLRRILCGLFLGLFNQSAREHLGPDNMERLKKELKTLPTMTEQASAIRSWMEENKKTLARITQLSFGNVELTYVPPELSIYFPNLRTLELSNNQLKVLPEGFGSSWRNLQDLRLNDNQLKVLPEGFGSSWVNLRTLTLYKNQLDVLPEGFGSSWRNLQDLRLSDNQLKVLPEGFGSSWKNLRGLALYSNQLEVLPEGFGSFWPKKVKLYLYDNPLPDEVAVLFT